MNLTRVAILYGGKGYEHEVSLASAENLLSLIDRDRFLPIPILIDKDGSWRLSDTGEVVEPSFDKRDLTVESEQLHIDVVFPMLHGDFGEDGMIAGVLECLGIKYVGCRHIAGAVGIDKIISKSVAHSLGIPVVPSVIITRQSDIDATVRLVEEELTYPVFVKPATLGSSIGAGPAKDEDELRLAIKNCLQYDERGLIERYIDERRELEVAYLSYNGGRIFTDCGEIISDTWYDYDEKYKDGSTTRTAVRADIDPVISDTIKHYARLIVDRLGVRQLARIDFFLTGSEVLFNEINTMPGFTASSLYPQMIEGEGIGKSELVTLLLMGAME